MSARSGVDLALERVGKVLVERSQPFGLALISMPGCKLETILAPGVAQRPSSILSVNARGDLLYDNGTHTNSLVVKQAGKDPVNLQKPTDIGKDWWQPVLSDDGALVWKARQPTVRLVIRDLENGSERTVPLDAVPSDYEPIAANVEQDEFVLGKYPPFHVLVIDGHGATRWAPKTRMGVQATADAMFFRRVGDGWAAWDLNGDSRLEWSTPKGSGQREFSRSSIESLSIDPAQEHIAVSLSANTRLNIDEAIIILRIRDGKELFHRKLPKFSRVELAYLDNSHLAMNANGAVDVVRLPPPFAALDPSDPYGANAP
ncbi:MAG TPA: hypothetical protein VN634_12485 [Candidatus Limnocylindrales bacterium]|nr:hypothetical protein [Candidatus Limnocylindrales bacterium]